jgi:kumamolisin
MKNLNRLLVILLVWHTSASLAQTPQPAPRSPSIDRVTLTNSVKEIATAPAPVASSASTTLVRSELTRAEAEATIEFSVALKMRDFAGLQERIGRSEVISLDEMKTKYYPTAVDRKRVVDWLIAQGFAVESADKLTLGVFARGTVAQIERAFGTKFGRVKFAGLEYSSAMVAPSLPSAIAGPVLGINGLQPHLRPKFHFDADLAPPQKLINNLPPYTVDEIANAYNASNLGLKGSGQTIAIVIDTFPTSTDLTEFWQDNAIAQSLSNIELVQVVPGTLPSPSGEETLDVEWSSGMAWGAKVRVYATRDLQFVHLDQAYQAIIDDLSSQPSLHQISLSYGLGETYMPVGQMQTDDQYFAVLAGAGVTVFVSSGDGGSTPGPTGAMNSSAPVQVESPANDPNVTAVGGTSLSLDTSTGAVSSESAWSDGGGGSSQVFVRPAWQKGAGIPTGTGRLVPDVALSADPNNGGLLILNGQSIQIGGTSWSAPTWAGFCAMLNQARVSTGQPSLGLLGAKIYPLNGTTSFRDITTGSNGPNGTYNAGPGFDLCTGLGVPRMSSLVQSLTKNISGTVSQVYPAGDLNGDGRSDVVFRNITTNETAIWLMSGNTIVRAVQLGSGPANYHIAAVADLEHTGRAQIIWSDDSGDFIAWSIAWSANDTPTTTATSFSLPANYPVLVYTDLNGDGLLDVVQYDPDTGTLLIAKNNGSLSFSTQYSTNVSPGWVLSGAADLNGTGHPQLIWRNAVSGQVGAWIFSATQAFQPVQYPVFATPSLAWSIRGIGKVDTTPAQGLIWHNSQTGEVGLWKMNTSGSLLLTKLPTAGAPWQIAGNAYLDGSGGSPEILWVDQQSGAVGVWRINSSATSTSIIDTPGTSWVVQPTAQ